MSHCFGVMCSTHELVMQEDGPCPERGCEGYHGYTFLPCDDRCGEFRSVERGAETSGDQFAWGEEATNDRARADQRD